MVASILSGIAAQKLKPTEEMHSRWTETVKQALPVIDSVDIPKAYAASFTIEKGHTPSADLQKG